MPRRRSLFIAAPLLVALIASTTLVFADGPDPESIVRSLLPKPKAPVFRSLFNRGIEVEPDVAREPPPQIDLTVNFAFDSATLTNDGALTLSALGKALADRRLGGLRFRVIGHTDARGSDAYNQNLSFQRAQTVGAFLYQFYQIDRSRLELAGRGASELRDPAHPQDGINRRVQIVTILPTEKPYEPPKPEAVIPPTPYPTQTPIVPPTPDPAPTPSYKVAFDMLPPRPVSLFESIPGRQGPADDGPLGDAGAGAPQESDAELIAKRFPDLGTGQIQQLAKRALHASGIDALPRIKARGSDPIEWVLAEARRTLEAAPNGSVDIDSAWMANVINDSAERVRENTLAIDDAASLAAEGARWSAAFDDLPRSEAYSALGEDDGAKLLARLARTPDSPLAAIEKQMASGPERARLVFQLSRELLKCLSYVLSDPANVDSIDAKDATAADDDGLPASIARDGLARCRPRLEAIVREALPPPPIQASAPTLLKASSPQRQGAISGSLHAPP